MPQTRNLLPDNYNELFGVNTSSCVITNQDIQQETVLGREFSKEVQDGRNVFGQAEFKNDPRIRQMDELIEEIENDDVDEVKPTSSLSSENGS